VSVYGDEYNGQWHMGKRHGEGDYFSGGIPALDLHIYIYTYIYTYINIYIYIIYIYASTSRQSATTRISAARGRCLSMQDRRHTHETQRRRKELQHRLAKHFHLP